MPFDGANNLPLEVISHIFRFIPHCDIKESRLVCKRWYYASLDPFFIERERMVCRRDQIERFQRTLLCSERSFVHLRIVNTDPSLEEFQLYFWYNTEFWNKFGPTLKSLSITKCAMSRGDILEVLSHCKGIMFLEISGNFRLRDMEFDMTEVEFLPELQILRSLTINNSSDGKWLFDVITKCAPRLDYLHLSDDMDTRQHVLDYVRQNGQRVFDLSLILSSQTSLEGFASLVTLPNARLRTLEVLCRFENSLRLMDSIVANGEWLQKLTLACKVGDILLDTVCLSLSNLVHLDIGWGSGVVHSARKLALLKNLTSLRLDLDKVDEESLKVGLCNGVNITLRKLDLRTLYELPWSFIVDLARTHPALIYLNLHGCSGVTDRSVQAIFYYQVLLETLILERCVNVTDAGLIGREILGAEDELGKRQLDCPTGYSISRLKRLRALNVRGCKINGSSFQEGLQLGDIRRLELSGNKISKKAFECLFENNSKIEELGLDGCSGITDAVISVIKDRLPRLKHVRITL